jgi:hypothetical protein
LASFLSLFFAGQREDHKGMELFLILVFITILVATFTIVRGDGLGHTPEERSLRDWSNGSLPSRPFTDQPHH